MPSVRFVCGNLFSFFRFFLHFFIFSLIFFVFVCVCVCFFFFFLIFSFPFFEIFFVFFLHCLVVFQMLGDIFHPLRRMPVTPAQNFTLFFPSSAPIFALFLSICRF